MTEKSRPTINWGYLVVGIGTGMLFASAVTGIETMPEDEQEGAYVFLFIVCSMALIFAGVLMIEKINKRNK